jgi:starch synthase
MNGIDYNVWNPAVDELIPSKFSTQRMAGKAKCKKALQEKSHLPQRADVPLIGMISRMADQKGFDLIAQIAPQLFSMDIQFILLGTGEPRYHEMFEKIGRDYPEKAGINITFDNRLAHEIEAGADMFLMPSRFEPCGLNQLYSLKYGTVPIVRKTGGLADSIIDATPETIANGTGTGFVFEEYTPEALFGAISRAIESYQNNNLWKKIRANGMMKDYSWDASAKKYETLYQKMLGG